MESGQTPSNFQKLVLDWLYTSEAAESQEEDVEEGLDCSGRDGDQVIEAFIVVAIDPVGNVESTVKTHQDEVVRCEDFNLP